MEERGKKARDKAGRRRPLPRLFWVGAGGLLVMAAALVAWAGVSSGAEFAGPAVAIALPNSLPCLYLVYRATAMGGHARQRLPANATAWAVFLVSAVPAANAVIPGTPLFEGYVARPGDTVTLPADSPARLRLLIHGRVKQEDGDIATARFSISGTAEQVEGVVERVRVHRIGGRGRTHVFVERDLFYAEAALPPGTRALKLERLTGPLEGRLRLRGYPAAWPRWVALGLVGLGLLGIAILDFRLGTGGDLVAAAAVALTLGALIAVSGTPRSLTHFLTAAQLGAALLAILVGVVAGWITQRASRWKAGRGGSSS